jgi:putative hemolysin/membrane-bound inhibitor of C-type lysozyme
MSWPELRTLCALFATLAAMGIANAQTLLERANPASQHCLAQGGSLLIESDGSGGQFGVCRFDDNRQCEEWALLRGDCPAGGVRITGYVTPAARYCVLRGGRYQVLSGSNLPTEQGGCRFGNGKACAAGSFFNGLCAPDTAGEVVHAQFRCAAGKTVDAVFSNGSRSSVSLVLSDGRSLSLPQSRSGSGARYANAAQSFVFWNKGNSAFIEEDGQASYRGCSTQP